MPRPKAFRPRSPGRSAENRRRRKAGITETRGVGPVCPESFRLNIGLKLMERHEIGVLYASDWSIEMLDPDTLGESS